MPDDINITDILDANVAGARAVAAEAMAIGPGFLDSIFAEFGASGDGVRAIEAKHLAAARFTYDELVRSGADQAALSIQQSFIDISEANFQTFGGDPSTVGPDYVHARLVSADGTEGQFGYVPVAAAYKRDGRWFAPKGSEAEDA